MELIGGKNLVEQDNSKMALVMYKNFVYQMYNYTIQFKSAGVTKNQMIEELDDIASRLHTDIIVLNEADKEEIEETRAEILALIEKARDNVTMTYSTSDSNLTNKSGGTKDAGTGKND